MHNICECSSFSYVIHAWRLTSILFIYFNFIVPLNLKKENPNKSHRFSAEINQNLFQTNSAKFSSKQIELISQNFPRKTRTYAKLRKTKKNLSSLLCDFLFFLNFTASEIIKNHKIVNFPLSDLCELCLYETRSKHNYDSHMLIKRMK